MFPNLAPELVDLHPRIFVFLFLVLSQGTKKVIQLTCKLDASDRGVEPKFLLCVINLRWFSPRAYLCTNTTHRFTILLLKQSIPSRLVIVPNHDRNEDEVLRLKRFQESVCETNDSGPCQKHLDEFHRPKISPPRRADVYEQPRESRLCDK